MNANCHGSYWVASYLLIFIFFVIYVPLKFIRTEKCIIGRYGACYSFTSIFGLFGHLFYLFSWLFYFSLEYVSYCSTKTISLETARQLFIWFFLSGVVIITITNIVVFSLFDYTRESKLGNRNSSFGYKD